ncbi:hypothetical protein NKG05_18685 [Oerskovia sp. M15]
MMRNLLDLQASWQGGAATAFAGVMTEWQGLRPTSRRHWTPSPPPWGRRPRPTPTPRRRPRGSSCADLSPSAR